MAAHGALRELVAQVPEGHPHHPSRPPAELDQLRPQDWIDAHSHTPFRRLVFSPIFCGAVGFLGPAEHRAVSLLHVLWASAPPPRAKQPEQSCCMPAAASYRSLLATQLGRGGWCAGRAGAAVRKAGFRTSARAKLPRSWGGLTRFWSRTTERTTPSRARSLRCRRGDGTLAWHFMTGKLPATALELQREMADVALRQNAVVYTSPWCASWGLSGIANA